MNIKVGVSNRHIHLTKNDFEILFGKNTNLTKKKDLYQDMEFAANETVTIKSDSNKIDNVRIIGPLRGYTQVEISKTDSYLLKINPPYRDSGDLVNSAPLKVIGPLGEIKLDNCCIIPVRHIHINSNDDNFYDKQVVKVEINGVKSGIMDNVYIKKHENYKTELHIDTDDANAFNLTNGDEVKIIIKE